jgi:hypothetical protein
MTAPLLWRPYPPLYFIPYDVTDLGNILCLGEPRLAFAQRPLRPPLLGDVLRYPDMSQVATGLVELRRGSFILVTDRSVVLQNTVIDVVGEMIFVGPVPGQG